MKKLSALVSIMVIAVVILTSCGSSKKVKTVNPYKDATANTEKRVKIERDECENESLKNSEFLRGYGIGTSADQMMARDLATASARNEIVNQVEVLASNMVKRFNQQYLGNSGGAKGMTREDQGKAQQLMQSVADESLSGARVICSNTYMLGNNYEVHVCVELTNADYMKKTYNKLANEEKLLIDYNYEKYSQEMKDELDAYRKRKAEGLK